MNRSNMLYMDGHARYVKILPGGNPKGKTEADLLPYMNNDYWVTFPDLLDPTK